MQILDTFQHENQWFVSFIVRAIGFCPVMPFHCFGHLESKLSKISVGTALGMLPGLAATTLLGINISEPGSPGFIISIILTPLVSAVLLFCEDLPESQKAACAESLFCGADFQHKQDENSHVDYESNEYN